MKTIELSAALSSAQAAENLKNFVGLDAANAVGLMTPERLAAVAGELYLEGVYILYHNKNENNNPYLAYIEDWKGLEAAGHKAAGVAITQGDKRLVISLTGSGLIQWSTAKGSFGGFTTTNRKTAYADFNGQKNTIEQRKHPECNAPNTAHSFCTSYERLNANGIGLGAGSWWMPSIGEMFFIFQNIKKINAALSVISGAEKIENGWYWSSTEFNELSTWCINPDIGDIRTWAQKDNQKLNVRAVCDIM